MNVFRIRAGAAATVIAMGAAMMLAATSEVLAQNQQIAQQETRGTATSPASRTGNARPWEKALKKFYGREKKLLGGDPLGDVNRAKKKLYRDPLQKFGLPVNKPYKPIAPNAPTVAPPIFDPGVARLDRDGNGSVSRTEYMQGRSRVITPGFKANRIHKSTTKRLDSQFRRADRNRDGKVTAKELQSSRGRF